jgi:YbbR domain-containing protein
VTVSGPRSSIAQVAYAAVYVDLSQARYSIDGFYKPSPETSSGETVSAASKITVDPQQVHINVPVQAVRGYKSLPVLAPLKGQPKTGYGVVGVTVDPNEITAYGSPGALNRLSTVDTPEISLSKRVAGSFQRTVQLRLPKGVTSRTRWVTVSVQLAPVAASSSIQAAVMPRNLAAGLAVHTRPASVLVTVVGSASSLRKAAGTMRAIVDLAGYGVGTFQITPSVKPPSGLDIEGAYPNTVTVTITSG